jgi:thiosulfate/3-mercaptopyruvate sulfurtransferase
MFNTLIEAEQLAEFSASANWLVVDCRFDLGNPEAGAAAYAKGHIPHAIYAHLDRDLSGPITDSSGRHPLPSPTSLAATFGGWGITADTQVIAYDADTGAYAARLWWLLRWLGHEHVAVLNGGLKAWCASSLPLSASVSAARARSQFQAVVNDAMWLDTAAIAALAEDPRWCLLDARAPERFSGAVEPIDKLAGHIPGARNLPFLRSLAADGRFLPAPQLHAHFAAAQQDVADTHTIAMCGSGVTACHLLLAMEAAGKRGARLYAGSWSEWIRDPQRPVATGS